MQWDFDFDCGHHPTHQPTIDAQRSSASRRGWLHLAPLPLYTYPELQYQSRRIGLALDTREGASTTDALYSNDGFSILTLV